ncbi:MAG: FitA-like ribbon-helix-helix domain-containing protein [bacterium]
MPYTRSGSVISMTKSVQIRNVPEDVHRALRERAARSGMSLSDYLLGELVRAAERPPVADVLTRAGARHGGASHNTIAEAVREVRQRARSSSTPPR